MKYEHFQMEGLGTLLNSVMEGEFLTRLDLKDAYFSILVHAGDRKFLRFQWQGNLFPVQGSPNWVIVSTKGVHSGVEGAYGVSQTPGFQKCDLSERILSSEPGEVVTTKDSSNNMAVGKVGVYDKLEEIVASPVPKGRVLGVFGRYRESVGHSPSGEGLQNSSVMPRAAGEDGVFVEDALVADRAILPTLHTESLLEAAYYSWGVCPWPWPD